MATEQTRNISLSPQRDERDRIPRALVESARADFRQLYLM